MNPDQACGAISRLAIAVSRAPAPSRTADGGHFVPCRPDVFAPPSHRFARLSGRGRLCLFERRGGFQTRKQQPSRVGVGHRALGYFREDIRIEDRRSTPRQSITSVRRRGTEATRFALK